MAMTTKAPAVDATMHAGVASRWLQLLLGVVCMIAAAQNFSMPGHCLCRTVQKTFGWSRPSIQTAFTIFVIVQTWLTPVNGGAKAGHCGGVKVGHIRRC